MTYKYVSGGTEVLLDDLEDLGELSCFVFGSATSYLNNAGSISPE